MPAMTMDDGGWGAIATDFANALGGNALNTARIHSMGANYQKTLLEQEELRRKMEAVKAAVGAYPDTVPQFPEGPASPDRQAVLDAHRRKAIAYQAATANLAKNASDFAQGVPAIEGQNAISAGIPTDPRRQDVIQTQLSTIGGSLPNYASTPHTIQPLDAAGAPAGAMTVTRRMPEGPAQLVSPASGKPTNPFENSASSDQRLLQLSQKANKDPGSLTVPELEEAAVHLQNRHGVKITQAKGADGATTLTATRENPYPEQYNPLVAQVAELNWWRNEKAAAAREGRPVGLPPAFIPPAAIAPPDARTGGLVGAPVAPAGAPGAAAPAPVAPTVGGLPLGANAAAPVQVAPGDATPIRKEWDDQPAVKKFEQAILPYQQFKENIKVGTPQADISMIYNLAKIFDPDSVVREGEMVIWQKTGGPLDRLKGLYDKIVENRAALTPDIRAKLADTAERAMGANHENYKRVAERYGNLADAYGIPREKILPKIPELEKIDRKSISSITPAGAGPRGAPERSSLSTAPAAPAARPPGRTIRVRPDGTIEDVP